MAEDHGVGDGAVRLTEHVVEATAKAIFEEQGTIRDRSDCHRYGRMGVVDSDRSDLDFRDCRSIATSCLRCEECC